jgi:site-specific recombinase XerD
VRHGKRGRSRTVPLSRRALEAIAAWVQVRPDAADDHLLVSLLPGRPPAGLSADAVGAVAAKHARRAGLPPQLCTAHVLRHTFCTLLAEAGVALEVIAELAGHADLRTTKLYVHVTDQRRRAAIRRTFDHRPAVLGLAGATPDGNGG